MNQIEAQAADALLDRRLKINLPAPWPLRIFGQRTIPIWVKRPVASNLFRMSRLFVRMGIDPEKVKTESFGTVLEAWRNSLADYRLRIDTRLLLGLASEPTACLVHP